MYIHLESLGTACISQQIMSLVTRAAKDLLRNTISSVGHHNRIVEEREMWRQWDTEQGLTMMVSDDAIKARQREKRLHGDGRGGGGSSRTRSPAPHKRQRRCSSSSRSHSAPRSPRLTTPPLRGKRPANYWTRQLMDAEEKDPDRWGHSGYKELYPNDFKSSSSSSSSSPSPERKRRRRKKDHSRHHYKHICSKHKAQFQDSDSEILEQYLKERKRRRSKNRRHDSSSSTHPSSGSARRSRSRHRRRHQEHRRSSSSGSSERVARRKRDRSPSSSSSSSSSDSSSTSSRSDDSELVWEERKM